MTGVATSYAAVDLAEIDLLDHDTFVDGVPYGWFDTLRRRDPVHWHADGAGSGFWAVTSHQAVLSVSRDWETYSSEVGASALEDLDAEALDARRSMIDTDPPLHTELRRLVAPPFRPRSVQSFEGLVREVAHRVAREALAERSFDLVERIAVAVPIKVLCRLLGVPESDEQLMVRLGDEMIANTDPDLTTVLLDGPESERYRLLPFRNPAALEMYDYSRHLAQARRRTRRDDLMSALVYGTVGGRPLAQREIDAMFLLLVVAGNETTRQVIALSVQALLEHREQISVLAHADGEGWRQAVDELLRWTTPLHHFRRTATRSTSLGGRRIASGDKVVVWYTAANRDDTVFEDPYRLDLRRWPNPHTTFGGGGSPHRCIGEHLARLELRIVLEELLGSLPGMELDGTPVRIRSNFTNGLKRFPVRVR
ncbi:MAG TPA: cytochrome P450 [Acidimicrobiales bacterium]|nr:cytochrome P450 [Acidimicrobiales bacterium]